MARSLARANVRKAIDAALGNDPDPEALAPGHMRLYRHYKPSLQPGLYGIEAKQTVTSTVDGATSTITIFNYETASATNLNAPGGPENPNAPTALQQFNVVAPQFQIDPKVVDSVYPPPGYTDEGRVLPHIVFNDPHIPWDRTIPLQSMERERVSARPQVPLAELLQRGSTLKDGSKSSKEQKSPRTDAERQTQYVPPWMGLVVFDVDELTLTSTEEAGLGIPTPNITPSPTTSNVQQVGPSASQVSTPGAYAMSVGDYLTKITSRVKYELGFPNADQQPALQALLNSTDPTSIIFPERTLIETIFSPTIQFLVMSHVRKVNTVGFPDAGVEEEGLYSVCISKRTGPTSYPTANPTPVPVPQVVHLVSLEHLQESLTGRAAILPDRIGIVSLYSWSYLSIPPQPVNFKDTMTNLANNLQMLRPPEPTLVSIFDSIATQKTLKLKAAAQNLYDRLSLGYIISRWRTAVGQETVAFNRGPCVPLMTPEKPSVVADWPGSSNTGKEYQILDKDLGVMDVSYSSAWQLGKLLAISDNIFNSALLRFRSLINEAAASETRKQVNSVSLRSAVLRNVTNIVDELHAATDGSRCPARITLPSHEKVAPVLSSPQIAPIFKTHLIRIIDAQTAAGQAIYSDYSLGNANNSDWAIIHNWISDKLFLGGIPAHYLFPDPSLLPSEALRFFYIDDAWMDCFIDGALSVANHLEPVDDKVRRRIKDVYNVYLQNNIEPAAIKPPVPRYGFILRSAIIKIMPDIRVTVTCRNGTAPDFQPDTTRAPLVRLTKMDEYTIMGLVDCLPEEIYEIVFAQPPHQQRFVAAAQLDPTPIYNVRQLYTQNAPEGTGDAGVWRGIAPPASPPTPDQMAKWYDKGSRCVNVIQMTIDINTALNTTPNYKSDPDSVVLALELNDSSYQLNILPPTKSDPRTALPFTRQLWVGVDVDGPDDPIPVAQPVITISPKPKFPPTLPPSAGARSNPSSPTSPKKSQPPTSPTKTRSPRSPTSPTVTKTTTPLNISSKSPKSPTKIRGVSGPKSPVSPKYQKGPSTSQGSSLTAARPQEPSIPSTSAPITIHSTNTRLSLTSIPSPLPLNLSSIHTLPHQATLALPSTATLQPQYSLAVHPDYHGAPPLPYIGPDGRKTFSAHDYIPTETVYLFDLIFSLRLQSSSTASPPNPTSLVSLSISIPTNDANTSTAPPEPLLLIPSTNAVMLHNKRLLPSLSTTLGSLAITLRPRSGLPSASTSTSITTTLANDASFRLTTTRIAPIEHGTALNVLGGDDGKMRALCSVAVTETYVMPDGTLGTAVSAWEVVKREGGDLDLNGNQV